jgi:hypothetical protein
VTVCSSETLCLRKATPIIWLRHRRRTSDNSEANKRLCQCMGST